MKSHRLYVRFDIISNGQIFISIRIQEPIAVSLSFSVWTTHYFAQYLIPAIDMDHAMNCYHCSQIRINLCSNMQAARSTLLPFSVNIRIFDWKTTCTIMSTKWRFSHIFNDWMRHYECSWTHQISSFLLQMCAKRQIKSFAVHVMHAILCQRKSVWAYWRLLSMNFQSGAIWCSRSAQVSEKIRKLRLKSILFLAYHKLPCMEWVHVSIII